MDGELNHRAGQRQRGLSPVRRQQLPSSGDEALLLGGRGQGDHDGDTFRSTLPRTLARTLCHIRYDRLGITRCINFLPRVEGDSVFTEQGVSEKRCKQMNESGSLEN